MLRQTMSPILHIFYIYIFIYIFFYIHSISFRCDQAALRTLLSVLPSVTPFSLCSCHRIIMKFPLTKAMSIPKVKVTEVKTPFIRFQTVTLMHKAWCCLGEMPYCFSRSSFNFQGHMAKKNRRFLHLAFPDCNCSLNSPIAMKWYTKPDVV